METTETIREARRLTRPRDGRWLGGVAAGLGAYFDLNPAIYRIAFVALSLAGGTGILLYIAAWLVIPEEGEQDSIAAVALKRERHRPAARSGSPCSRSSASSRSASASFWPSPGNVWLAAALAGAALVWWQVGGAHGRRRRCTGGCGAAVPAIRRASLFPLAAGALLVASGVLALLDIGGVWNVDWRFVLGGMVVALGAARRRGRRGRPLGRRASIVLGVLVLAALALTARRPRAALRRRRRPRRASGLDRRARHDVQARHRRLHVNLADVPLPAGETHVKATLGIGDLTVHVPRGVDGRGRRARERRPGRDLRA